jgi:hypothetical protein
MRANLQGLCREVSEHLAERQLAIFRSYPRSADVGSDAIYWDVDQHPDFREFIDAATTAGARMITFYSRQFSTDILDRALERLEQSAMDRAKRRALERDLTEMRPYEGFICQVELSFTDGHRTYIFDQATPWYDEMMDLIDQIEETDPAEDDNPLAGYYSNN